MGNRLHTNLPSVTRTVFKYLLVAFCVAVFVDNDHIIDGHRGILHEPFILLVGCFIFVGFTFGGRLFKSRILKEGK